MSLTPAKPSTDVSPIEVPKLLSEEQVHQFVHEGYVVMPELLEEAEIADLKADVLRVARGEYPSQVFESLPVDMSDEQVLANILCIHQPHCISEVMLKYVTHAKIAGVLSQTTAAHLPYWDGAVKCMQSMYFVKPPGFQGQAWHQDEIYIPTRDRSLVGAWIAVDDASCENGCLWILPGSHRTGYLYSQREHHNEVEFDQSMESYGFDDSQEVPVEVKAGTVVFFNGHLLHRSRKNNSDVYRRVLVSHYMNAWSLLPWQAATQQTPIARSDDRTVIPVAGIDPYAWKGYEQSHDVSLRRCKANIESESA